MSDSDEAIHLEFADWVGPGKRYATVADMARDAMRWRDEAQAEEMAAAELEEQFVKQCAEARDAYRRGFTASLPVAVFLESTLGMAGHGLDELLRDRARLDFLEDEMRKEDRLADAGFPTGGFRSLFRRNMPITRAGIDNAIAAEQERTRKEKA